MIPDRPHRPAALQLAVRMQKQITGERLQPGARYLGAEAAARHFRVRKAVANQALQILAQRGLLIRKPRLGAIIAEPTTTPPHLGRIVLLTQADHPDTEGQQDGAVVSGLQTEFPGADVHLQTLSGQDAATHVEQLIGEALKSKVSNGLILIRGSAEIQRRVAEGGLPAVVYGSVWPGVTLSSLNVDNAVIADMLTRALVQQGARRLLLLRRDRATPGENALLQGTLDAARSIGVPLDVLELPAASELIQIALQSRLSRPDSRCAVLAATPALARGACRLLPERSVACGSIHPVLGRSRVLRCLPDTDFRDQGKLLGRLLLQRLQYPEAAAEHQTLTCHLKPATYESPIQ